MKGKEKKTKDLSLFKTKIEKGEAPIMLDSGVSNGASVSVKIPDSAIS